MLLASSSVSMDTKVPGLETKYVFLPAVVSGFWATAVQVHVASIIVASIFLIFMVVTDMF